MSVSIELFTSDIVNFVGNDINILFRDSRCVSLRCIKNFKKSITIEQSSFQNMLVSDMFMKTSCLTNCVGK